MTMTASTKGPEEVEKMLLKQLVEEDLTEKAEKLLIKELHGSSCNPLTAFMLWGFVPSQGFANFAGTRKIAKRSTPSKWTKK